MTLSVSSSAPTATAVRIGAFLGGYFRRYVPLGILALAGTAVFAFATVTLLALFRPILSDVLLADSGDLEGVAALVLAPEDEEPEEAGRIEEFLGFQIDLDQIFESLLARLKATVGIDAAKRRMVFADGLPGGLLAAQSGGICQRLPIPDHRTRSDQRPAQRSLPAHSCTSRPISTPATLQAS